jgi:hypothetical protein
MQPTIVGIKAETITPFAYHSLMIPSGTATLPELIGDRAIAFALASTLGYMAARVVLPTKDYRRDLAAMPYRCSVFTTAAPKLLPPITRRINLGEEGGFNEKLQSVVKRGNFKDFFRIQEVPPGQVFYGAIFNLNPFQMAIKKELVLRIGLHRNGMVRLTPHDVKKVCLNAATAALFGRELPVERYCLHSLQLTPAMSLASAAQEVALWQA